MGAGDKETSPPPPPKKYIFNGLWQCFPCICFLSGVKRARKQHIWLLPFRILKLTIYVVGNGATALGFSSK